MHFIFLSINDSTVYMHAYMHMHTNTQIHQILPSMKKVKSFHLMPKKSRLAMDIPESEP